MSNKLSPGHEMIVRVGAKTVSQASVKSGKPNAGLDRGAQILRFRIRNAPHRIDRDDQIVANQLRVGKNAGPVFLGDDETVFDQEFLNDGGTLRRLMSFPATPHDECVPWIH